MRITDFIGLFISALLFSAEPAFAQDCVALEAAHDNAEQELTSAQDAAQYFYLITWNSRETVLRDTYRIVVSQCGSDYLCNYQAEIEFNLALDMIYSDYLDLLDIVNNKQIASFDAWNAYLTACT